MVVIYLNRSNATTLEWWLYIYIDQMLLKWDRLKNNIRSVKKNMQIKKRIRLEKKNPQVRREGCNMKLRNMSPMSLSAIHVSSSTIRRWELMVGKGNQGTHKT